MPTSEETDWLPIIGRSLAFLCLHYGDYRGKDLAERGMFLEQLGLPRKDSAALLGTTENSLRVTLSTARKAPTKKKATAKKVTAAKNAPARKKAPGTKKT